MTLGDQLYRVHETQRYVSRAYLPSLTLNPGVKGKAGEGWAQSQPLNPLTP